MPNQSKVLGKEDLIGLRRVHVTDPSQWGNQAGTDFWLYASGANLTAGHTLITEGGWTATSLSLVAGAGADFMTKDDVGTPGHYLQNAAADLLQSPAIFGSYDHAHMAAVICGQRSLPRFLVLDAYATFSTLSADEVTTNLGFVEDGGSIVVAADAAATFYSKGTGATFNMQANAAVVTGLVTVSTTPNWFRIILDKANAQAYYYINNVYNGVTPITNDEFPLAFGAGAGTTNRILLNQAHIFYAWQRPLDYSVF